MPSYEELLEPLWKRYRLDAPLPEPPQDEPTGSPWDVDDSSGTAGSGCFDSSPERRRPTLDDAQEPSFKRYRDGPHEDVGSPRGSCGSVDVGRGQREEASLRGWAEEIVRTLDGCPSAEEAIQRCASTLSEYSREVRQAAVREGEVEASSPEVAPRRACEGSTQSLQHTNKILMRAIHHLAQRCKQMEAAASEVPSMQQALEQAHEVQRRLQHSNEVLQEHLKVHLNSCR